MQIESDSVFGEGNLTGDLAGDVDQNPDTSRVSVHPCEGVGEAPTLEVLYTTHFALTSPTGCTFAGCHGDGVLAFDSPASFHAATVGVPSVSTPTLLLIAPGEPDDSLLYRRLVSSEEGPQMPIGGPFLDAQGLEEVKAWICAGAPAPATVGPEPGCPGSTKRCRSDGPCLPADACCEDAECVAPERCGGGGQDNVCGCTPTTCLAMGATCGALEDGCGGELDCGGCLAPEVCGGAGDPLTCGCQPLSCMDLDAACGLVDDGCGETLDCGVCAAPEVCGGGGTANQCGCISGTCESLSLSCGVADDGCGETLDCGACLAPETCGGGGIAGQCGCTPLSCLGSDVACGPMDNGCGQVIDCGGCVSPEVCGDDAQCGCAL
ncbi:MAG: hypothetical protein ACPGU1_22915 [Myxococcota bacterium]